MFVQIIKDVFITIVIIIASVTFGNLILRDRISVNRYSLKNTLLVGGLTGLLGCILMIFNVRVSDTIIVDFRYIPIMIMALYYSFATASITAGIIGLFRILFFGMSLASGISLMFAILMAIACGIIGKLKVNLCIKWGLSLISVAVITGVGFSVVLKDSSVLVDLLVTFYQGLFTLSIFSYFFMQYIVKINKRHYLVEESYTKDYLTGLDNIRSFDNAFNAYVSEVDKIIQPISLLFIDIDFFNKVNNQYGHIIGDNVLAELGNLLKKYSREFDLVARKGGEEFTILLKNCNLDKAKKVAGRIITEVEQHIFVADTNLHVKITVSAGIASYPETTDEIDRLIEQADMALYKAKRMGRNRFCVANRQCGDLD